MKKSLIALATLVAFAGAASAQSSVTIGGKLDLGFGKAIGSTDKQIRDAAGSRLNFNVREDLGGGMAAVGSIEHRFNPDDGTDASAGKANFWNGHSYVGLQGGFGRVMLGRFYTASFSLIQNQIDPFGGDTVAALRGFSMAPGAAAGTPAAIRFANGVRYDLTAGGFNFAANMAEKGQNNAGAPANNPDRPYSIAANYSAGPLFVGAGIDNQGGANDKLVNLGARYTIGGLTLRAGMGKGKNNANADVKGTLLGGNFMMGAGNLKFGVATLKTGATTSNKRLGLGYQYNLSKRTFIYTDFARDSKAATNKTGYDFGIQHNF